MSDKAAAIAVWAFTSKGEGLNMDFQCYQVDLDEKIPQTATLPN